MATVGGVDVGAAVIDCGSWALRAGLAGEDSPQCLIPAACGRREVEDEGTEAAGENGSGSASAKTKRTKWLVGDDLLTMPQAVDEVDPVMQISDKGASIAPKWDLMETLWQHVLKKQLLLPVESTPIMLIEGSYGWGPDGRAAAAERVFEGIGAKSCFVARSPVMAAFSAGRGTALVVDIGHQGTYATTVVDGYALEKSKQSSPLAGRALSEYLLAAADEKAGLRGVRPRYEAEKPEGPSTSSDTAAPMQVDSGLGLGKRQFYRMQIVHDMKQSACAIVQVPDATPADGSAGTPGTGTGTGAGAGAKQQVREQPATTYELPDGTTIDLGTELADSIPESLFDASLLKDSKFGADLSAARPLHRLAYDAASACDIDARRELYGGLVLTGGSSLFPGLTERFQRELAAITPQMFKLRLVVPSLRHERAAAPWIGGSILSSLGTFHQMWMSKQEYDEHGAIGINRKCP